MSAAIGRSRSGDDDGAGPAQSASPLPKPAYDRASFRRRRVVLGPADDKGRKGANAAGVSLSALAQLERRAAAAVSGAVMAFSASASSELIE